MVVLPFVPGDILLTGSLVLNTILLSSPTAMNFEFESGPVQMDLPVRISGMTLTEPKFLGAGGGGSVWAMRRSSPLSDTSSDRIVMKISWARSAESVRNECKVLKVMEERGVTGVERCLGSSNYQYDPKRVVIAMEPFFGGEEGSGDLVTANLTELSAENALRSATQLGTIMAQMIAANVVTNDIQPLIIKSTGETLLIDMTEAKVLESSVSPLTDIDKVLVNAFCTEVLGLIPESLLDEASKSFLNELSRLDLQRGIQISSEMKTILRDLPITGIEDFFP